MDLLKVKKNPNSEHLSDKDHELLRVGTGLEESIREDLQAKKVVVLTGHPGDGKTFLADWLIAEKHIDRDRVASDWSELDDDDVVDCAKKILEAREDPEETYLAAINEGPLFDLLHKMGEMDGFSELRDELRGIVVKDLGPDKDEGLSGKFSVYHMQHRRILKESVIEPMLGKFIEIERQYIEEGSGDDAFRNHAEENLRQVQAVKDNLIIPLLTALSAQVEAHFTMRQLSNYLIWLVAGYREDGDERLRKDEFRDFSSRLYGEPAGGVPLLIMSQLRMNLELGGTLLTLDSIKDLFDAEEGPMIGTLPKEVRRKHRAFILEKSIEGNFEIKDWLDAAVYERSSGGVLKRYQDRLESGPDSTRQRLIGQINRFFFRQRNEESTYLYVFTGERLQARLPDFLAANKRIHHDGLDMHVLGPTGKVGQAERDDSWPRLVHIFPKDQDKLGVRLTGQDLLELEKVEGMRGGRPMDDQRLFRKLRAWFRLLHSLDDNALKELEDRKVRVAETSGGRMFEMTLKDGAYSGLDVL